MCQRLRDPQKGSEPINAGTEFREGFPLRDQNGQIVEDVGKGRGRLLDDSQGNVARKVFRRDNQNGQNPRQVGIVRGKEIEVPNGRIEGVHVVNDVLQACPDHVVFDGFAP